MSILLTLWRFRQVLFPLAIGVAVVVGYLWLKSSIREDIEREIEGVQIEQRVITIERKQEIQREVLSRSDSELVDGILRSGVRKNTEDNR